MGQLTLTLPQPFSGAPNDMKVWADQVAGAIEVFLTSVAAPLAGAQLDTATLKTSTVTADPTTALGVVSRQYADTKAPLPTSASGVGQLLPVSAASGVAAVLPAGGTWGYWIQAWNNSTYGFLAQAASVANGGATIGTATAGYFWTGFCWRIT